MENDARGVRRDTIDPERVKRGRSRRAAMFRLLICVFVALFATGCRKAPNQTNPLLERVEPKEVCMVNNRYMGSAQTPVVVENKTYYGCCPMCEQRLRDEPATRSATDPVSRRRVDKATAVIGKLSSDRILYFESEKTFAAYRGPQ